MTDPFRTDTLTVRSKKYTGDVITLTVVIDAQELCIRGNAEDRPEAHVHLDHNEVKSIRKFLKAQGF